MCTCATYTAYAILGPCAVSGTSLPSPHVSQIIAEMLPAGRLK